jgi:chromosome partitioning protein
VHLALAFIKYHNLKIAIIDTDPQGSLGQWFMIRTEKKLPEDNLTFKTASLWGAQYESKTLKKDHDIVIIDTPPKIESDARPSIEAADLVLIPMSASHVDFWATGAIVEIAKKADKKILVQINRSNQRSKLISKTNDFIKSLNLTSTKTIIGNRQIYTASMGEGKTAVEKQRKGNAVEEIKQLSEEILSQIK